MIIAILLFVSPIPAKENSARVTQEVEKLIDFIKVSDCKFNRNGSWFEAIEGAEHINTKYQYVQKKGLVKTAEDFIKYAATKSSISGEAYIVQCGNDAPQKSAEWLTTALAQIRAIK
ncbi:MAG: DUF5329 domain-containing protein [Proteobacteria bacterium]|nr:DUF5329 domain-containing protein [Pseudomonadota bacterium]